MPTKGSAKLWKVREKTGNFEILNELSTLIHLSIYDLLCDYFIKNILGVMTS